MGLRFGKLAGGSGKCYALGVGNRKGFSCAKLGRQQITGGNARKGGNQIGFIHRVKKLGRLLVAGLGGRGNVTFLSVRVTSGGNARQRASGGN